mmetsp:Transcript_13210/g.28511  ORF Transcript_13210/g.28511 Transcript_13210/m.28511 type:complete len:125 (-) Transcript_13210:55-429(-)
MPQRRDRQGLGDADQDQEHDSSSLDNGVETLKIMRGQDVRITNSQADYIDAKLKLVTVSTTDEPHQVQTKFNEIERLVKQLPESRKVSSTRPVETLIEAIIPPRALLFERDGKGREEAPCDGTL